MGPGLIFSKIKMPSELVVGARSRPRPSASGIDNRHRDAASHVVLPAHAPSRAGAFNTWYTATSDGGATWSGQVTLSNLTSGAPYKSPPGTRSPTATTSASPSARPGSPPPSGARPTAPPPTAAATPGTRRDPDAGSGPARHRYTGRDRCHAEVAATPGRQPADDHQRPGMRPTARLGVPSHAPRRCQETRGCLLLLGWQTVAATAVKFYCKTWKPPGAGPGHGHPPALHDRRGSTRSRSRRSCPACGVRFAGLVGEAHVPSPAR